MPFLSYKYAPLLDLFESDFIDLDNSKDYIPFGEDNLLPQQIVQLSRSVAIHRSILNSKSFYIAGNGFVSEDKPLKQYLKSVNNNDESLRDVFYKLIFDELNTGNSFFEVITDMGRSYLVLYHVDSSMCRLSSIEDTVIIHPDWSKYKGKNDKLKKEIPLYPYFSKGEDGQYHSIIHIKQYEPEFFHYGLPTWYAGLRNVIIAGLTDVWNQNRLENQFNKSGLLIIPGINTESDEQMMNDQFDGLTSSSDSSTDGTSNNLIIQYLNDPAPGESRDPAQYIPFQKDEEGNWIELYKLSHTHLLSIHNWFKTLSSYFGEKTGFDTQRILNEYEIALKTIIKVYQARYIDMFKKLLADFGYKSNDLSITNESPVYRLNPLKYVWELRREMLLDYDPNDPKQQLFYSELKNTFTSERTGDKNKDGESSNDKF